MDGSGDDHGSVDDPGLDGEERDPLVLNPIVSGTVPKSLTFHFKRSINSSFVERSSFLEQVALHLKLDDNRSIEFAVSVMSLE